MNGPPILVQTNQVYRVVCSVRYFIGREIQQGQTYEPNRTLAHYNIHVHLSSFGVFFIYTGRLQQQKRSVSLISDQAV